MSLEISKLIGLKRKAERQGWLKFVKSEADEKAMLSGCWFDPARAEYTANFFPRFLCHSKDPWRGKPFELLDWQRDEIIYPIFGWIRENNVRRFTRAWVEIPKKNGKSTFAAGIGLYMLAGDGEGGAEIYSVANDRVQAGIVHNEAMQMVEASPELCEALSINKSTKTISYKETGSWYRALAGDAKRNEGLNGHAFIADEIHSWSGRKLFDAIRYGMRARSQPLFFVITTAGDDPASVAKEQHDHAVGVLNGTIEDRRFFAYIRAADEEDDPLSEETWRKANPSYGLTINADEFCEDAQEAANQPSSFNSFKRYSLNIWTTGESPAIDIHKWNACKRDYTEADLEGRECFAGLDLSKVSDTTSLQLYFPEEDGTAKVLSYFWLPEETARDQNHLVSWLAWAERNYVELTPGRTVSYKAVIDKIAKLADRYDIRGLAYDPWNAEQTSSEIEDDLGIPRYEFRQSMRQYADPSGEFEKMILEEKLHHNGHPVQSWQAGNLQWKTDESGNKRPIKPKPKDYRKVDGPCALIMAIGLSVGHEGSSYDNASDFDVSSSLL